MAINNAPVTEKRGYTQGQITFADLTADSYADVPVLSDFLAAPSVVKAVLVHVRSKSAGQAVLSLASQDPDSFGFLRDPLDITVQDGEEFWMGPFTGDRFTPITATTGDYRVLFYADAAARLELGVVMAGTGIVKPGPIAPGPMVVGTPVEVSVEDRSDLLSGLQGAATVADVTLSGASLVPSSTGNTQYFKNDGRTLIDIEGLSGSPQMLLSTTADSFGISRPTVDIQIASGTRALYGPFPTTRFGPILSTLEAAGTYQFRPVRIGF